MDDLGVGAAQRVSHAGGLLTRAGLRPDDGLRRAFGHRAVRAGIALLTLAGAFFAGTMVEDAPPARPTGIAFVEPSPAPTVTVTAPPVRAPLPAPTPVPTPPPAEVLVAEPAPASTALRVTIADLGIDQPMISLGIQPNGSLEVPEIFDDIGWWSGGPAPGDPGAALVVGHVDSVEGPAVFHDLPTLEVGDVVSFMRPDGTVVRFSVTDKQTFPKDDFPDDLVYRLDGKASVHLVTCGGVFDRSTGHYRDNIVVFADLIDDSAQTSTAAGGGDLPAGEVTP